MIPAHVGIALQEVIVAHIAIPVGNRIVPGRIYVVPRAVDLHQIPAMIATAGKFTGNPGRLQHERIGLGIAVTYGGTVNQRTVTGVGGGRQRVGIQAHIILAVEYQIVVQGLDDIVIAHLRSHDLLNDPLCSSDGVLNFIIFLLLLP